MDGAHLSHQETWDLLQSILEGVDHIEGRSEVRDSWPDEMRQWADLLIARLYEEGGPES